jgi:hypothetical protein
MGTARARPQMVGQAGLHTGFSHPFPSFPVRPPVERASPKGAVQPCSFLKLGSGSNPMRSLLRIPSKERCTTGSAVSQSACRVNHYQPRRHFGVRPDGHRSNNIGKWSPGRGRAREYFFPYGSHVGRSLGRSNPASRAFPQARTKLQPLLFLGSETD